MKITSSAFQEGWKIPERYTADGMDINPPLEVFDIPEGTKSLVLVVDDPDAQRVVGYTWLHWLVFDIPVIGKEVEIMENSVPQEAKQGVNDFKKLDYGGPSPPPGSGIHNYHFKVYALDTKLELPEMASLEAVKEAMEGHVLGEAELVGQYSRDQ